MLCSSWLRVHLPLVTALLQSIYLTELCSVDDILQRPHSWNTRGISFNFHTMAPPVEDLLRHHIISTTCRLASVDCWQVAGAAEQLSPRWTHFNYGSGFLPADFTLSRLSTHSDKMGRCATIGVAPAAKETLLKPSKCLSHYTGAEIKPGKHWLTSVSFLWDPMSPAAKGDLLIGMVSLYGNSSGKESVNTGKWNSARAEKKTLGFIMHSL